MPVIPKTAGSVAGLAFIALTLPAQQPAAFPNHGLPFLDAHNCYPQEGEWSDRIDRALLAGSPIGIEQDLAWYMDPATGRGRAVVTHTAVTTGREPALRNYFFERVRPVVEKALAGGDRAQWPLIVLHFDFKDNQAPLLRAVWDLLGEYEPWITTAVKTHALKTNESGAQSPLELKPLLVLTEDSDAQEEVFYNQVAAGARLRLFGSAHTHLPRRNNKDEQNHLAATLPPNRLLTGRASNYRRWWNNSWYEVEEGGQPRAGAWTAADDARLKALVNRAHALGYWIRFYTLDGFAPAENRGWSEGYNFGSSQAARIRWQASIDAGVNMIATDQYEDLGALFLRNR